jgi:hypothetical protein
MDDEIPYLLDEAHSVTDFASKLVDWLRDG